MHHPRKWAPWCSFSRGTYPRICSPRENVHHADRLILNLTALSSSVAPEQLHMLRGSSVFIFFLCEALTSHRVHVDEEGCSQTTLQLLIRRRAWFDDTKHKHGQSLAAIRRWEFGWVDKPVDSDECGLRFEPGLLQLFLTALSTLFVLALHCFFLYFYFDFRIS